MVNIGQYTVSEDCSIRDAFVVIDANLSGSVFVLDDQKRVVGIATDGDIRRWLLKDHNLDDPISVCMNRKFVFARPADSREHILKLLDHRVRIIPVLSEEGQLTSLVTKENFPLAPESGVLARSRSPVRISFGGGGTDLTHYYWEKGGAVISATVALYSRALLRRRSDMRVRVHSDDLNVDLEAEHLDDFCRSPGSLGLVASLLRLISPRFGFELEITSDFPVGSGLGGSSVVLSAIIGCFNEFRMDRWDRYEMAEMAFQAERLYLNIAGGWQDQYATVFGGFNFIEFDSQHNVVHPIRLDPNIINELEESLVLCHTGSGHDSGSIHDDQKRNLESDKSVEALVDENKQLTYRMKSLLLRGRMLDFGKALDEAWNLKRRFSSKISSGAIDTIYEMARDNGAIGGKLLGAGGGGYFLFYSLPGQLSRLRNSLHEAGHSTERVRFEERGLHSWTVRQDRIEE